MYGKVDYSSNILLPRGGDLALSVGADESGVTVQSGTTFVASKAHSGDSIPWITA